ncbi:RCC1 domain-containing protein [Nocardioides sp. LML1-1-1.1]|uniref:RCC1 domain-containing protein n=1 Tax=Nocardioides sp. LML1-1-1.1 TaxID=3135248 RepID=UPI00342ED77B
MAQTKVAATLAISPSTVVTGVPTTVTLTGKVSPFAAGTRVVVQRLSGATWVTQTTAILNSSGAFTATATASGTTTYRVVVPASGVRLATVSPARTVSGVPATPVFETTTLPDGIEGKAYAADLDMVGDPPGTWTITGLPAGLSYSASTGAITGTPTAAGTASLNVLFTQTANGVGAGLVLDLRVDAPATAPAQVRLSAGGQHGCRVNTDQTLDCWGYNFAEQIAQPLVLMTPYDATPTQVGAASDWVEVSSGGDSQWAHTCGIRADRSLWCWGSNRDGELGNANGGTEDVPVRAGAGRNWATVSSGFSHTCGVTTDGELWCWGGGSFGQLGRPGGSAPAQVGVRSDWTSVSASYTHTCATTTGGELWCWGFNPRGQLGDGSTDSSPTPVREATLGTSWASVSVGAGTSCALRTDATLWCWGYNAHGETGTGAAGTDRLAPTQVGTASDWTQVSATGSSGQGNHACAVNTGGQLWCWGYNLSGETGADPGTDVLVPTRIGTDSDWASVATGGAMTYAAKTGGSQWAWGANGYGQLGKGFADIGGKTPVGLLP